MGVLSNSAIIVLLVCIGGNGIEAKTVVGDFKEVADLKIYNQLYEVTAQALPSIKRQSGMSHVEVLNYVNAEMPAVEGTNWKITIDTKETYGQSSRNNTITFTVEELLPTDCPSGKTVCIKKVLIVTPPNGEAEQNDVHDEFVPVPNFKRVQALYQAYRLVLLDLEETYQIDDITLVTFLKASLQLVEEGTNWKITLEFESPNLRSQLRMTSYDDLEVSFDVFQPLPGECKPEGIVCVKDLKKVKPTYGLRGT